MNAALMSLTFVAIGCVLIVHGTAQILSAFIPNSRRATGSHRRTISVAAPIASLGLGTIELIAGAELTVATPHPVDAAALTTLVIAANRLARHPTALTTRWPIDVPLTFTAAAAAAFSSAGRDTIDHVIGWNFTSTRYGPAAIGVCLVAAAIVVMAWHNPQPPAPSTPLAEPWSRYRPTSHHHRPRRQHHHRPGQRPRHSPAPDPATSAAARPRQHPNA